MALSEIPIKETAPAFKIRIEISGVQYIFRFIWNNRSQTWVMDLYDANENPLATGINMVVNFPLLYTRRVEGLPNGVLILFDTKETNQECGRNDLGERCKLYFLED